MSTSACLKLIPNGRLASSSDEDAAAKHRRSLAEKLRDRKRMVVGKDGTIDNKSDHNDSRLEIPPGKLASFYWYEREPDLLDAEIDTMGRFFPDFSLSKLEDGRMQWIGQIDPVGEGCVWTLQVVYDHNHPNNSSYGGSVKIYSIDPDLEDLREELGNIPHVLLDHSSNLYLCTSQASDFKASSTEVTSAAQSLAWAAKWIAVFHLWLEGEITTEEFEGHTF